LKPNQYLYALNHETKLFKGKSNKPSSIGNILLPSVKAASSADCRQHTRYAKAVPACGVKAMAIFLLLFLNRAKLCILHTEVKSQS
jgi:hypothetical protein